MMNVIRSVTLLLAAAGFSFATKGEDGAGTIQCQIAGMTNIFSVDALAVYTHPDG